MKPAIKISPINRAILSLAVPSVLANITTPLLGLVDTAIVGHMGNALYIAAIGVGSVMFNMCYWLFDFLRAGTSGLSAQAFGAANRRLSTLVLLRSMLLAFVLGMLMIILQRPLFRLLSAFLNPGDAQPLVEQYFFILIYGAPAALANFSLSGWFLGRQKSSMLLWISIVINVTNIGASLLLVYVAHLGIKGLAGGTLLAQWCGLLYGILRVPRESLTPTGIKEVLAFRELREYFSVNIDVMLRTACIIAVTVWFTRAGATQGPLLLAVNTLLMQFFYIFSYLMDGFAFAGEALVGKYSGAGQAEAMKSCIRSLFRWGIWCASLFSLIFFLGGETILAWLSDDRQVVVRAGDYYIWAAAVPLAGFAAFVWDGVYIGAMLTRRMLITTSLAGVVFFLGYIVLFPWLGNHGLWISFLLYLLSRGLLQTILWQCGMRRHKNRRTDIRT